MRLKQVVLKCEDGKVDFLRGIVGSQREPRRAIPSALGVLLICFLPFSCTVEEQRFTDVTEEAGIDFMLNFGDYSYVNILESSGSGVTVFDYDNDGWMDLYMMNGTWRYFASERQAIEEENEFRRQLAQLEKKPFSQRVYVSGVPICPRPSEAPDESWNQQLICKN